MAVRALAVDTDLSKYLHRWSRDLKVLRQNSLLSEPAFLSFARDRGLGVSGAVTGDPSEFYERGWLSADGRWDGKHQFHPFRFYVLHEVLCSRTRPSPPRVREWNEAVDLAIVLDRSTGLK